jgi:cytochrome c oxidase assembly protein subunit 15
MPGAASDARSLRRLSAGFFALCAATFGLIVLGALVRAHGAGLACPDWPLCFGRVIPAFDLRVAFEWTHRAVAGGVALGFAGLALAVLRRPAARGAAGAWLVAAALLLVVQIALGALTVWKLLAAWTVTSHLVVGNAFAASLLWIGLSLRPEEPSLRPEEPSRRAAELSLRAAGAPAPAAPAAARAWLAAASACLALQLVLGGLVSSRYAGLACPEWPTCYGGAWWPSSGGPVALHLLHRTNGYLLLLLLGASAFAARGAGALGRALGLAAALGAAQVVVGVLNVRLGLPVEITGLHSALAAALVLSLAAAAFFAAPRRAS